MTTSKSDDLKNLLGGSIVAVDGIQIMNVYECNGVNIFIS